MITEVGGTVGDIEGQPFYEAIRQMILEEGRDNTAVIHTTLLPHKRCRRDENKTD